MNELPSGDEIFTSLKEQGLCEALIAASESFSGPDPQNTCRRAFSFMIYDLEAQSKNQSDEDKLAILNHFFFNNKKFRNCSESLFIRSTVENRKGHQILLSILYARLGQSIGLNLKLLHIPNHHILSWSTTGHTNYIDLSKNGQRLTEDEWLALLSKHSMEIRMLNSSEILVQYLSYLSMYFRQTDDLSSLHRCLNVLMELEPENIRTLTERALVRKKLGLMKESLQDFKRYFSFTNDSEAPIDLVLAFKELKSHESIL